MKRRRDQRGAFEHREAYRCLFDRDVDVQADMSVIPPAVVLVDHTAANDVKKSRAAGG
ncbi:MAG: hypothetical protein JNL33_16150 [Betaproteobacteria bacterium]|nr:hypothetical protein [Betaproteobacteria bacterium]